MNPNQPLPTPQLKSYLNIMLLFVGGGVVTAAFSASLVHLTTKANLMEVLSIGMIVPSFTWLVQLSASGLCLRGNARRAYWLDLGWICLIGSFALLPAAIFNFVVANPPWWPSAANVIISVALMSAELFRRSIRNGRSMGWPISWTLTIILNMTLFVMFSRSWW